MNDRSAVAPRSKKKPKLARVALFVASFAVVVGVLEAGLRVRIACQDWIAFRAAEPVEHFWALPDEDLGYRLDPDYGDHNALGLRDDPVGPKGGRLRVLVLGDSLGYYGPSIAETWVGRLEAQLGVALGSDAVDVVNACVKGYTTHQELLYLERDGSALKPDVVVLGFVLNDLHRFLHTFRVREGRILDAAVYATGQDPGAGGSRLAQWLRWRLQRSVFAADDRTKDGFAFERRIGALPAWQDEPWEMVRQQLRRFVELGQQHGFRCAVIVFPVAEQYREADLDRDRDFVRKPQRKLAAACAELDLPLCDLYATIEPGMHLDPDGLHLSATGRTAVAERVAEFLLAEEALFQR